MSSYVKIIYDKIEFLEFKQNILFLKQPQHKASIFAQLTLDDFINIRNLANEVEVMILVAKNMILIFLKKNFLKFGSPIRSYPYSTTLIAKALLKEDTFNSLFKNFN